MALHRDLTGSDLHEPKGVAGAAAGRVYVADGAASGSWTLLPAANVAVADPNNVLAATTVEAALYELYTGFGVLDRTMADVSNPSTVLIPVPFSCVIQSIDFILGGAITAANSTLTITRADGAAMGTQVIAFSGSAEGSAVTFTPSGNNTLTYPTHRYIKIVTDGNSSTATPLYIQARIARV